MLRRWLIPLALVALAGLVVAALRRDTPRPVKPGWPVNIGHRGSPFRFPENTVESFRAAVEAGARGLELDVRLTRDGQLVVMHDETVDRTTDGSGPVSGMTLREVRHLNARGADGREEGHAVPTLAQVLEEFPDAAVNIDIKDAGRTGAGEEVLRVLREVGATDRVLVVSAYDPVVRRFRRIGGAEVATGASRFEIGVFLLLSALRLERLARPGYAALQVPVSHGGLPVVTPRFVAAAHARGVRVDVWTIDEPGEMRRLLDLGVDAVMTDKPEVLAEVLRDRQEQGT